MTKSNAIIFIEEMPRYSCCYEAPEQEEKTPSQLDKEAIKQAVTPTKGRGLFDLLPSADENARPGYPGEYHTIVRLPNGKFGRANFMGPGTKIAKRVARGDPPRAPVDEMSEAHDIRYALATKQDDIREADRKYLEKNRTIKDSVFNRTQAKLIAAKQALEAAGIGPLFKPHPDEYNGTEIAMMRKKLDELEQKGYGPEMTSAENIDKEIERLQKKIEMLREKKRGMRPVSKSVAKIHARKGKPDVTDPVKKEIEQLRAVIAGAPAPAVQTGMLKRKAAEKKVSPRKLLHTSAIADRMSKKDTSTEEVEPDPCALLREAIHKATGRTPAA